MLNSGLSSKSWQRKDSERVVGVWKLRGEDRENLDFGRSPGPHPNQRKGAVGRKRLKRRGYRRSRQAGIQKRKKKI